MGKNLFNKIWWLNNKKPSSPGTLFWINYANAMMTGFIGTLAVACVIAGFEESEPRATLVGIAIGAVAIFMGIFDYQLNKRRGYIDAEHKRYLERREEIGKSLGKIV